MAGSGIANHGTGRRFGSIPGKSRTSEHRRSITQHEE